MLRLLIDNNYLAIISGMICIDVLEQEIAVDIQYIAVEAERGSIRSAAAIRQSEKFHRLMIYLIILSFSSCNELQLLVLKYEFFCLLDGLESI